MTEQVCVHHWVIESAYGPVSPGVCQHCGATSEFRNSINAEKWGDGLSTTEELRHTRTRKGQHLPPTDKYAGKRAAREARHAAIVTAYMQIITDVGDAITKGVQKIREDALALEFECSRSTVCLALRNAGLISKDTGYAQLKGQAKQRRATLVAAFNQLTEGSFTARYKAIAQAHGVSFETVRQAIQRARFADPCQT